jgi:hypothetical protein
MAISVFHKSLGRMASIALLVFSSRVVADNAGPINDMHYAIWDADQNSAICFEVGTVWYAFLSSGSAKHNAVTALLISNFARGATISVSSSPNPMSPTPCQSWDVPGPVYQAYSIAFYP